MLSPFPCSIFGFIYHSLTYSLLCLLSSSAFNCHMLLLLFPPSPLLLLSGFCDMHSSLSLSLSLVSHAFLHMYPLSCSGLVSQMHSCLSSNFRFSLSLSLFSEPLFPVVITAFSQLTHRAGHPSKILSFNTSNFPANYGWFSTIIPPQLA